MNLLTRKKIQISLYNIKNGVGKIVKSHALVFITVFFGLLLLSCGLPSYPVLYPPVKTYNNVEVSFLHDQRNVKLPNFSTLGYDVIYRVYDASSIPEELDERDKKIEDDINNDLTDSKLSFIISNDWDNMIPYRRLYVDNTNSTVPLIDITSSIADNTLFKLSFENNTPDLTSNGVSLFNVARNVGNNPPVIAYFNYSDFSFDDPDTPWDDNSANKPQKLVVAFFAFTFGRTFDTFMPLHSDVIYIGSIDIVN